MKDPKDIDTIDWVGDADERRQKEEQDYIRRLHRKFKHERRHSEAVAKDRKKSSPPREG